MLSEITGPLRTTKLIDDIMTSVTTLHTISTKLYTREIYHTTSDEQCYDNWNCNSIFLGLLFLSSTIFFFVTTRCRNNFATTSQRLCSNIVSIVPTTTGYNTRYITLRHWQTLHHKNIYMCVLIAIMYLPKRESDYCRGFIFVLG